MTGFLRAACRRWGLFAGWVIAALVPAEVLLVCLAPADIWVAGLPLAWTDLVAGPLAYYVPILLGVPPEYDMHPMAGISTCVYAVCLPLAFAHPARPGRFTACVTSAAFIAWYSWACLALVAHNAPC